MARPTTFVTTLLLALLAAAPARAQFGTIFNDGPPRPPGDIPNAPPSNQQFPPYYPNRSDRPPPPDRDEPPAPAQRDVNAPPAPAAPLNEAQPGAPPSTLPGLPPGQRQPRGAPQLGNAPPQPGDKVVVEPAPQRIGNPTAVFSGLDKITGRIISFDVAINETVQFGALQVTPRACYSRPA